MVFRFQVLVKWWIPLHLLSLCQVWLTLGGESLGLEQDLYQVWSYRLYRMTLASAYVLHHLFTVSHNFRKMNRVPRGEF